MTCPRCQIPFNARHWGECPHCGPAGSAPSEPGASIPQIEGVIKTSTILISTDDGGVFGSLEEVPQRLRETLVACTTGPNAATIIIADQGGRARIAAALNAVPLATPAAPGAVQNFQDRFRGRVSMLVWAGLLVAGFSGGLVWLVISQLR